MKKTRLRKKRTCLALFLAWTLLLSLFVPAEARADTSGEDPGNIVFSVEKFSIGQGYLIEPVLIPLEEGDTYASILLRALAEYGYTARYNGSADYGFYLQGIENADSGVLNIPSCIQNMPRIQAVSYTHLSAGGLEEIPSGGRLVRCV